MHCAAQTYGGILSILYLNETCEMGINQKDSKQATPLHFAVLQKEIKNVELLIKLGIDLNA